MIKQDIIDKLAEVRVNRGISETTLAKKIVGSDANMVFKYEQDIKNMENGDEPQFVWLDDYQMGIMRCIQEKKIKPTVKEKMLFVAKPQTLKIQQSRYIRG